MADLSPEVREALEQVEYLYASEAQIIRAELLRLTEECDELRRRIESAQQ